MSLTFIANVNDETDPEQICIHASSIWNKKPETAIKLFFFILDQHQGKNQPKAFVVLMEWLYKNHQNVFYKNLSLVVGRPNDSVLDPKRVKDILSEDYEKHENVLKNFIDPEFRNSFRSNWESTAKACILNIYSIPQYGSWEVLIDIAEKILIDKDKKKEKLFYTVINLFDTQIKLDIYNKQYSEALETIKKYPIYRLGNQNYNLDYQINNTDLSSDKDEKTHNSFKERYILIVI